jgi:hypothetical protein
MTRTLRHRRTAAIASSLLAAAALLAAGHSEARADGGCASPTLDAVSVGANGSATTAPVVVGSDQATVCFSVLSADTGTLKVDAVYATAAGTEQVVPVTLSADGLPTTGDAVELRFTSSDGGTWDIGDVHIDPYGKG